MIATLAYDLSVMSDEYSAFCVPLDIHYDEGSLNIAADGPVQEYE
jgi:hypothetical protein